MTSVRAIWEPVTPDTTKAGRLPGFDANRGLCRAQVLTPNPEGLTAAIVAAGVPTSTVNHVEELTHAHTSSGVPHLGSVDGQGSSALGAAPRPGPGDGRCRRAHDPGVGGSGGDGVGDALPTKNPLSRQRASTP